MKHLLHKYFPQWFPVEKCHSDYNQLEVLRQNRRLLLNAPHVNYSFGSLHEIFRETFQRKPPHIRQNDKILLLGFGAGSVAHILRKEQKIANPVTGIEIDPEVIRLARKYFELDRLKDVRIILSDAADFLSHDTTSYGLIVVDLFLDHRIPEKFQTGEFLQQLHRHLIPKGTVFYNFLLFDFTAKQQFDTLEKLFASTFRRAETMRFTAYPKTRLLTGEKR